MTTAKDTAWDRLTGALAREAVRGHSIGGERGFPHFSEDGRWQMRAADEVSCWQGDVYEHGNWTFGFWYGVMWLSGALTGTDTGVKAAVARLDELRLRSRDDTTHDLGFMFWPSLVFGNRLGYLSDAQTEPAIDAARTLAARFNDRGGYIQAFGAVGHPLGAGTSTIDTMMNLPLLYWAGTKLGDERLLTVAHRHASTSKDVFIRPDGSTYHLNHFDPDSGALLHQGTFQGASEDSCWSRGQAWAVCGFALSYAATRDPEMLAAATKTADYFWSHLPSDALLPWDFTSQDPDAPRDASAGAIAALGALVLAAVHPDAEARRHNQQRAATTLEALAEHVSSSEDVEGILQRSSYSVPHGLGMNGATAWGEFYFTLAFALLSGRLPIGLILDGPHADRFEPLP